MKKNTWLVPVLALVLTGCNSHFTNGQKLMETNNMNAFTADGRSFAWHISDTQEKAENGVKETVITWKNGYNALVLTEIRTTYEHYPVAEWRYSLKNTGKVYSGVLKNVLAADLDLKVGENPVLWHGIGESEKPEENYSFRRDPVTKAMSFGPEQGYSTHHAFPYFRLTGAEKALTIAIGWCGCWKAEFAPNADGTVHFTAGQKNLQTYLKPNEEIVFPRITVLTASNEEEGAQIWRAWFREYILPRENGEPLQPKFVGDGTCPRGELYTKITIGEFLEDLQKLRNAGFKLDAWWIDAGWYSTEKMLKNKEGVAGLPGLSWFTAGLWVPDPKRMPDGLKPLSDELRKTNTDLVLWYESERVHEKSPNYDAVKQYLAPYRGCESGRYDLSRPEVLEYVEKSFAKSVLDNGVSIYRQDSNGVDPNPYWESSDAAQGENRKGITENHYIQNMYKFWDYLRTHAGIKFIDNCASGGRRNDLETLRHNAVPLHYSDTGYEEFIHKQRYTYMLAQWFLYYKNIVQFDQINGKPDFYRAIIDLAPFYTINAVAGQPLDYLEEKKLYAKIFDEARPYLINANYHLLTPEVFAGNTWTVCQYHDPKTDSGLIRAIRNPEAPDESYTVKPLELDADKTYVFTDLLGKQPDFELSGEILSEKGFALSLAQRDATVLKYRAK